MFMRNTTGLLLAAGAFVMSQCGDKIEMQNRYNANLKRISVLQTKVKELEYLVSETSNEVESLLDQIQDECCPCDTGIDSGKLLDQSLDGKQSGFDSQQEKSLNLEGIEALDDESFERCMEYCDSAIDDALRLRTIKVEANIQDLNCYNQSDSGELVDECESDFDMTIDENLQEENLNDAGLEHQ